MIHTDGSLVCHDGGFYTRKSFQAELGAAAALVRLHMQTGMAVNVDRILRKIQKEQDIILNAKQQVAVKMSLKTRYPSLQEDPAEERLQ